MRSKSRELSFQAPYAPQIAGGYVLPLLLSPKAEFGSSLEICSKRQGSPKLEELQDRLLSLVFPKYRLGAHYPYLRGLCVRAALLCPVWPAGEPWRGGVGSWGSGLPGTLILRRDGGSSCVGPARSHRSCHTEVKPEGGSGDASFWDPLPG